MSYKFNYRCHYKHIPTTLNTCNIITHKTLEAYITIFLLRTLRLLEGSTVG